MTDYQMLAHSAKAAMRLSYSKNLGKTKLHSKIYISSFKSLAIKYFIQDNLQN